MKRMAASVAAFCLAIACLTGQALARRGGPAVFAVVPEYGGRDLPAFLPALRWDISMDELKPAKLGAPPVVTGDTVAYHGVPLLDQEATVVCLFGGDAYQRLDMVLVILHESDISPEASYRQLLSALCEQYGEPGIQARQWTGIAAEDSKSGAGAVARGIYQEYALYECMDGSTGFRFSCTLEDWEGELLASVLFQRDGAGDEWAYYGEDNAAAGQRPTAGIFYLDASVPGPDAPAGVHENPLPCAPFVPDGIAWGMSHAEVRALTGNYGRRAAEDSEQWLRYEGMEHEEGQSESRQVSTAYYFEDDALKRFYYIYKDTYPDKSRHLDDYDGLGMLLADALGEPTSSGVEWRRYVYKDNPEQYGLAVSLGDLRFSESWVREAFYVTHGLVGEDHAATHYLEYAEPGRAR